MAQYIWHKGDAGKDEYAEFFVKFAAAKGKIATLKIACDGIYSAYLNGKLVAFSAFSDFPDYKLCDEIDITDFCKAENEMKIVVWYFGVDSQTYIADKAGVVFEVTSDGKTVAQSDGHTLSRKMNEYKNGYLKPISRQLGLSYKYDNSVVKSEYAESAVVDMPVILHKKGILPLELSPRLPIKIIKNDKSVLIDMGIEVAGFLEIDIVSPVVQNIIFAYGEHLKDGKVRRKVGTCDFSVE